jgi:hypothetical protein
MTLTPIRGLMDPMPCFSYTLTWNRVVVGALIMET